MTTTGGSHRVLVVANKSCPCETLLDEIAEHARGRESEIRIVAPALNGRLAHLVSDTDGAVAAARTRLDTAVSHLRDRGLRVSGDVGDTSPMHAILDELAEFPATEVIISTFPPGQSHWIEKGLIKKARGRLRIPVHHVVSSYGKDAAAA